MLNRCPLPLRASFRDVLRDLTGRSVTVRAGPAQQLDGDRCAYLAGYRFDEGDLAAIVVADADLSVGLAGALAAMPPQDALDQVAGDGILDEELFDFFHEIVNISAKLLNSPTTPHVALREVTPVPGEVPEDVADRARRPARREDWRVGVDSYGEGTITFLA